MKRIAAAGIGMALLALSILLGFPRIIGYRGEIAKLEIFSRYLIQSLMWCFLSLLAIECILRVVVYNPPLYRDSASWAGDIPAVHSTILWGREGFAITQYEKWGEIRTPHHDGNEDNDVIVLGDSQTEALQVDDDIKFTSFAETTLLLDGYDVDLHNLGRSGLAMADYVSWIPAYQNLYRPRIIVVQLTEDDFIDSFHEGQFNYFIAEDDKIVDLFQAYDLSKGFIQRVRKKYYWDGFQIQQQGAERWDLMRRVDTPDAGRGNQSVAAFNPQLAAQQVEMLIEVAHGVPMIVLLLPSVPHIADDQLQMTDQAHEQLEKFMQQYPQVILVDPLTEFQRLAASGHLPRGFFNTQPDVGHLNQYGHEVLGRLLAAAIERILK